MRSITSGKDDQWLQFKRDCERWSRTKFEPLSETIDQVRRRLSQVFVTMIMDASISDSRSCQNREGSRRCVLKKCCLVYRGFWEWRIDGGSGERVVKRVVD